MDIVAAKSPSSGTVTVSGGLASFFGETRSYSWAPLGKRPARTGPLNQWLLVGDPLMLKSVKMIRWIITIKAKSHGEKDARMSM